GGDVVADFTGIGFANGTSVGAGQVLEFYINAGVPGVIAGFIAFGFLLMRLDQGVMRAIEGNDWQRLLLHAMPGLALLQPGGNLLEMMVSTAAGLAGAHLIAYLRLLPHPAPAATRETAASPMASPA